ncbi:MAG: polysaccharide deacetylase family protein [Pseudomonadota bacterium]|nr:polysaccharide deacetylase family protein [Pseudomonadota bacterium]
MARIALKVDVDTLRGSREGVPRLLDIFARADVAATFLFSLGPDHTGWALRRVFRRGFLGKASRTSVLRHYGLRTLTYGVLLPGPDIGRMAGNEMRAAAAAGHECGIHAWDHVRWQDNVRHRDAAWTREQMGYAYERFGEVFGRPPSTHGAAGWQTNDAGLLQIDAWGMAYASDGRGTRPFIPVVNDSALSHVQLPTTLPTLDELIGLNGVDERNVARSLLAATEADTEQVFTLHAELEGGQLAPVLTELLAGWRAQGHQLGSLATQYAGLNREDLVSAELGWQSVSGRSGELVVARD